MVPILALLLCLSVSWSILQHAGALADRLGLIDRPDEPRKIHTRPTPRIGGIAFGAALAVVTALGIALEGPLDRLLVCGGLFVILHLIMGMLDDRYGLPASWRLLVSIGACMLVMALNPALVIGTLRLGSGVIIAIPFAAGFILTTLGVVFFIFSVDLMDGRNGILGASALWWLALLQLTAHALPGWAFVALAGTLLVFLHFNLKGRLFAGDGGAYVVGAGVALLALSVYARAGSPVGFDQLMVVFLLPIVDAARVLVGRISRNVPPFRGDDSHLHHVLWRRAGERRAMGIYAALMVVPALGALLWPAFAIEILGGAVGLFFMAVNWSTASVRRSGHARVRAPIRVHVHAPIPAPVPARVHAQGRALRRSR